MDLFSEEAIPVGYNVHFYCNIFHIFSDWQCEFMAKKSLESLPSGGRIVICEMLFEDDRSGPLETCLFDMVMFNHLAHGRQFTKKGIVNLMEAAGFVDIKTDYFFGGYSLIHASKP